MPTEEDKDSAGLRFEGEARRLHLRRPRPDRDGLYLFGRRYAAQVVTLGEDDLRALRRGRVIAVDVLGEYLLYVRGDPDRLGDALTSAEHRCAKPASGATSNVPQRERANQAPSDRVRVVAARVRMNADKRAGVQTPDWIKALAQTESSRPAARDERNHGTDDAFDDATLVANLRELLGAKLTAYLASTDTTRIIRKWANGTEAPSYNVSNRLRFACRVALLLRRHEPVPVVQAWFTGLNPGLDDASPARIIREEDLNSFAPRILDAAQCFIAHG